MYKSVACRLLPQGDSLPLWSWALGLRTGWDWETGWRAMTFNCSGWHQPSVYFLLIFFFWFYTQSNRHSVKFVSWKSVVYKLLPYGFSGWGSIIVIPVLLPMSILLQEVKCDHLVSPLLESYFPHWNQGTQFHMSKSYHLWPKEDCHLYSVMLVPYCFKEGNILWVLLRNIADGFSGYI